MIRILIFEDNKSFRSTLSEFLESSGEIQVLGAYPDAREVLSIIKKHKPDLVLMDIQMPFVSGLEALATIKKYDPAIKVLIQSIHTDDDKIFNAICNGSSGYILKNSGPDQYLVSIKEVMAGGSPLSPSIATKVLTMFQEYYSKSNKPQYVDLTSREREILNLLAKGKSYKMIADICYISVNTVCTHMAHIYEKLHVNSATEAMAKAREMKIV